MQMWEWLILGLLILPVATILVAAVVVSCQHTRKYGMGDEMACQLWWDGRIDLATAERYSKEWTEQHMAAQNIGAFNG